VTFPHRRLPGRPSARVMALLGMALVLSPRWGFDAVRGKRGIARIDPKTGEITSMTKPSVWTSAGLTRRTRCRRDRP
jgi:hypothetical protein